MNCTLSMDYPEKFEICIRHLARLASGVSWRLAKR